MMPARAQWVDYARGIGIVLVVYGHVARGVHSAGLPIDEGWFRLVDSVIYSFHMPLFFFLSGLYFLASMQRHGAGGLLVEKLRTVAWPYLVWSVLQGLTEVLLASATNATNGKVTLAEVASLLWQPRAQFWFLYALFFMSLAALPFYRFLSARWYRFVTIAACLAFLGAAYLPGGIPVTYLIQNGPYFTLGVLLGHVVGAQRPLPLSGPPAAAGLAIAVGFQWLFHGPLALSYAQGGGLLLALAMTTVLAVVLLCMWLERFNLAWLAALGRASLAIYVMHILAGSGVRIVLQKLLAIDAVIVHLVLGTLLGIGLPLLVNRLMERHGLGCLLAWPRRHG